MAKRSTTLERVRAFALSLPEAHEDHPWGESVAKVNKKVFVFFGHDDDDEHEPGMSVKLAESNAQALMVPGAEPTGYGLGRGGWVNVPFRRTSPPLDVLKDWVEESYRIVAPKRISARLDGAPAEAPAKKPTKKVARKAKPRTKR